jgi:hypothetical protein
MKYLGKENDGQDVIVELDVQYPEGPTVLNVLFQNAPTQTITGPGEVIVRLDGNNWPVVFTEAAFNASFTKIEE